MYETLSAMTVSGLADTLTEAYHQLINSNVGHSSVLDSIKKLTEVRYDTTGAVKWGFNTELLHPSKLGTPECIAEFRRVAEIVRINALNAQNVVNLNNMLKRGEITREEMQSMLSEV
jgi:hypothetical protein